MADMFNELIRSRLSFREGLPNTYSVLEGNNPTVTTHPNATAEVQGMPMPVPAPQAAPQSAAPSTPQQPNPLAALTVQLLEDLQKDRTKKATPIGPDLFGGGGGILGTGISPATALMYALGGLVTSRMPQDQALAMTMKIGGLPTEFANKKEELAQNQIGTILAAFNAQNAQGNLANRQLETQIKQAEAKRTTDAISFIEEKLASGKPMSKTDAALAAIRARQAGIDPSIAKELFLAPDLESQLATFELIKNYAQRYNLGNVAGSIDLPGGQKVNLGSTATTTDRELSAAVRDRLAGAREAGKELSINDAINEVEAAKLKLGQGRLEYTPQAFGQRMDLQENTAQIRARKEAEQKLGDLASTQNQLDSMFRLADTMLNAETQMEGIRQSAILNTQSLVASSKAGLYNAMKMGLADTLARSLGGQRGVLTDLDIARTVGLFPTFGDTKATMLYKKQYINSALQIAIEAANARIDGKAVNMAETRKRYNAVLTEMIDGLDPKKSKPSAAGKKVY